jgi:HAD superfamily hydrolase (TIGR01549 family)
MIKLKKNIKVKKKYNYFFFDLDGVLINSIQNMENAWNTTSKKFNLNIKFSQYKRHIGIPFLKILKKLKIKKKLYLKIQKNYELVSTKNLKKIRLYKDVKKILNIIKKISGNKIAIVTSKNFLKTKKIIKSKNLKFDFISAPIKNLKGKPYPDQIIYSLKKMKISNKKKCIFIGDTENDYFASSASNIDFVHVSYGYGSIKNIKHDKKINLYKIRNILELKKFI